ncbi:hypothetical protein LBMAG49_13080 [Planctomycetota bacterium]|nr:hypothetical protein LBMAG49_13080 [Planctomycetota bacterium]
MCVSSGPAILARGIGKSFRQRLVLNSIELHVERGELIGLIGKNGAGKSTLLRILTGLIPRDRGEVSVLGMDPSVAAKRIRERTGYLPGETSVYQQMTGQQFLDFALSFYPRRQTALLDDLLDIFALPLQQRVRNYSAGMKQKLALIASLSPDLDLYLLDEPDRALDASIRFQLRDVLLRMRNDGRTFVLSSHHLSEVETLADRLEFLLDGSLVAPQVIAKARARLQRLVRIKLTQNAILPTNCTVLTKEADGTMILEPIDAPLDWLKLLPPSSVCTAEIGIARLEDLYKLLLAEVLA